MRNKKINWKSPLTLGTITAIVYLAIFYYAEILYHDFHKSFFKLLIRAIFFGGFMGFVLSYIIKELTADKKMDKQDKTPLENLNKTDKTKENESIS